MITSSAPVIRLGICALNCTSPDAPAVIGPVKAQVMVRVAALYPPVPTNAPALIALGAFSVGGIATVSAGPAQSTVADEQE
ncbi:hypothetical protein ACFQFC_19295 [Amorphoplanes digitatis]|uniref:Uncharacterized protein n=1 Tax=Actinoplanes digitatis TaxID=1868 RepID=A0A7W7I4T3_9ACTN|nr:hypothetical protein [Actinoplanes digitatis]MBB4766364.1 hypothetical protein [Actinoplanes digitatis]